MAYQGKKPDGPQTRINEMIRASELRVLGKDGENLGVLTVSKALEIARSQDLDLIEISPKAVPPVAKIMDYGKFQYDQKKKMKVQKAKAHNVEVKSIQIKIGTDENDLNIKAKRASNWLEEGHRVKIELFLPGRSKYLDKGFLKERFDRILNVIKIPFSIAEEIKSNPKGLTTIIEKKR